MWIFWTSTLILKDMNRKRIIIVLALILASASIYADKAYWYTNTIYGERTDSGALFNDDEYSAASDSFKLNSVVEITNLETDDSVVVIINDTLPKTAEGRTIAVTRKAAEELGILQAGIADVDIRLIRGEMLLDEEKAEEDSGWYSYDLGLFETDKDAYKVYTRLLRNNQKPKVRIEDGKIRIILPFIREFDREDAEIAIALSGVADPIASKAESPFK